MSLREILGKAAMRITRNEAMQDWVGIERPLERIFDKPWGVI